MNKKQQKEISSHSKHQHERKSNQDQQFDHQHQDQNTSNVNNQDQKEVQITSGQKRQPGIQSKPSKNISQSQKIISKKQIKLNRQNLIRKQLCSINQKYTVKQKLGEGSFGQVFKVKHKKLQTIRAMKTIQKSSLGATHNTYQQLQILKKIDHPNVLKIYQYFQTETQWLIITEYFQGRELFDEIIAQRSLSQKKAAIIFSQICKSLAYIHAKGIVHRDIKPENILVKTNLVENKQNYEIKLIDWGLGARNNKELSRKCGTPQYCAPEVIKGEYGFQCDLWSLGVLLYVMLVGKFPFKGDCVGQTLSRVTRGVFKFKSPDWDHISFEVKDLITKLLQKKPDDRPSATTCLKHPWILLNLQQKQRKSQMLSHQLSATLSRLKQITIDNKFTAVVINFIKNYLSVQKNSTKMKQNFEELDQNGDGVLSFQELLNGYKKIYGSVEAQKIVQEIFTKIDLDCSGEIQYNQFITFASDVSQNFSMQQLKQAFRLFDRDGNGQINKNQINNLLSYEKGSQSKDFDEIINMIDLDGNGCITLDQFIDSINKAVLKIYPECIKILENQVPIKQRLRKRKGKIQESKSIKKDEDYRESKSNNKNRISGRKSQQHQSNSKSKSKSKSMSKSKSKNKSKSKARH